MPLVQDVLENGTPGDWEFATVGDLTYFRFLCPCCGQFAALPVNRPDRPGGPSWFWDLNHDAPSLHPSIRFLSGCGWHGFMTSGKWVVA